MSWGSDTNCLPRDENECRMSAFLSIQNSTSTNQRPRLNRQHRLWTKTVDYLIHPSIERSLPSNARIADVATGNGYELLLRCLAPKSRFLHSVPVITYAQSMASRRSPSTTRKCNVGWIRHLQKPISATRFGAQECLVRDPELT
jgi:hypothetical protein